MKGEVVNNWSGWTDTKDKSIKFCRWPGVYQIRLANEKGNPETIPRFLVKDAEGLLIIGKSKNLATRLKRFSRAFNIFSLGHSTGERLFIVRIFSQFQKSIYKNTIVQFRYMKLTNVSEAEEIEGKFLMEYLMQFGELPPLNSTLPIKSINWKKYLVSTVGR